MTYALVICSYRYGHLAAHAIETAISQTKPFDKIYFVDDGVGDCGHLPKIYPEVEFVLREKNLGTVANFQDMLMRVKEDWVMFLGADNWLSPDTLEVLDIAMDEEDDNGAIVTYDIILTGELRHEIADLYLNETKLMIDDNIYWDREGKHHGSMLYNVEKAKSVGGYAHNGGVRTDEDLNLWNKLKSKYPDEIRHVASGFLYYRRHRENFNKY